MTFSTLQITVYSQFGGFDFVKRCQISLENKNAIRIICENSSNKIFAMQITSASTKRYCERAFVCVASF